MALVYFFEKGVSIVLNLTQYFTIHIVILYLQLILLDIKPSKKRTAACAFFVAAAYMVTIYGIDFICFMAGTEFPYWLTSMVIPMNPFLGIACYFVFARLLNLSHAKCGILVRNHVIMHYAIVCLFFLLCGVIELILPMMEVLKMLYLHEFISVAVIIALLFCINGILRRYLAKTRKYIKIMLNYNEARPRFYFIHTFCSFSLFYVLIVAFRLVYISSHYAPATPFSIVMYCTLISLDVAYLVSSLTRLRNKLLEHEMQATGAYVSSLLHINQDLRALRHDYADMIQTYGGYLSVGDYEGLQEYHNTVQREIKASGENLLLLSALKSRIEVYALLEAKKRKADSLGVGMSFDRLCDISRVVLSDLDLCRVLDKILDNAVDEASRSGEKLVTFSLKKTDRDCVLLVVSNSTGRDIGRSEIFEDGDDANGDEPGSGLMQALHILNSYEHCTLRADYHDRRLMVFLVLSEADK